VVVPFAGRKGSKEDLWAAQRDWIAGKEPQRLAEQATRLLDRVERELEALQSEIGDEHPEPSQLERLARGESSREEGRTLIRHLASGCPRCSAVLRPLIGMDGAPRRRR
jgi:hypothetical protein